ncbi:hypothetical protein L3Y34_009990 [Caenorhabditis briggsae]|uniref:RGS domain-containing protein n=1 Tax=Caenorhabditis briggsae TaxID=6238 RepID=A0AAE9AA88_CAEBR|nr:hypothetical protein L3Y34_009990 [Caenorhabditis briggsae]
MSRFINKSFLCDSYLSTHPQLFAFRRRESKQSKLLLPFSEVNPQTPTMVFGILCGWCVQQENADGQTTTQNKEEPVPPLAPEAAPTYEIVYSWSFAFDNLMKYRHGQKHLAEFLKGEFSDENILFWQACEELKRERNSEKIEEKARIIYEDFISILSPKEVSLDSRVRDLVNTNMGRPSTSTFNEAQNQIYVLMQRDSYPRYVNSAQYRKLLESFGVREMPVD